MAWCNAYGITCAALISWASQLSGVSAHDIPRSVLPGIGPETSRSAVDVNAAPWRGAGSSPDRTQGVIAQGLWSAHVRC